MIMRELLRTAVSANARAALARRDEVRARVAQRLQRAVVAAEPDEAPDRPQRHLLQEHTLDRRARAELEHGVVTGVDQRRHASILADLLGGYE